MKNPIKVSDQIYRASIDMRTGHLKIDKKNKYTVSEVYQVSTEIFGVQNRYRTTEGFIFGEMTCVLCRSVDKKRLEEEADMKRALDHLLNGVSLLKMKTPADAADEIKKHIKNLESDTIGIIEAFRKNYNTEI